MSSKLKELSDVSLKWRPDEGTGPLRQAIEMLNMEELELQYLRLPEARTRAWSNRS